MEKLVSIIIPIYNAEKDLDRCIKSIINQTYKKFELILVNDGSSDKSEEICKKYAKKDKRVKYIYQQNSGVSKARNFGFENSVGEFIYYVDADDFLEINALETFMKYSNKYDADIVRASYKINKRIANETPYLHTIYNRPIENLSKEIIANFINYRLNPAAWLLFMKREVAEKNLFLQNFGYGEDLLYTLELLLKCKKIVFIENILYNYIVNDNGASMSHNKYERNISNLYNLVEEVNKILILNKVRNIDYLINQAIITYFYMIIQYIYLQYETKQISFKEFCKKLKKYRNSEVYKKAKISKLGTIKKYRKIIMRLFEYRMYILIFFLYKLKKIIKEVKN